MYIVDKAITSSYLSASVRAVLAKSSRIFIPEFIEFPNILVHSSQPVTSLRNSEYLHPVYNQINKMIIAYIYASNNKLLTAHSIADLMKQIPYGREANNLGISDCPHSESANVAEMIPS